MGWIGIPCDSRPSNREINQMVQQRMETPTCRIIDRSGWQVNGRHQFLLMEAEPKVETDKAIRFIVVILIKYHQHELLYKEVEESMGPNELDCPMRIMNQLERHPPTEGYSARWRERILQHHQDMKPRKAILRKLRKEYPNGDRRLVLTKGRGREVQYGQGRYRSKQTPAYRDPDSGDLRPLRAEMIDPEATKALRTQPAHPQEAIATDA